MFFQLIKNDGIEAAVQFLHKIIFSVKTLWNRNILLFNILPLVWKQRLKVFTVEEPQYAQTKLTSNGIRSEVIIEVIILCISADSLISDKHSCKATPHYYSNVFCDMMLH